MFKSIFVGLSFVLCLANSALAIETAPAQPAVETKVGLILALSGDAASFGIAFRNGFELGLESLAPEDRAKLKVFYEDDGLQTKNAVTALKKLTDTEDVDVIVSLSSGTSKAIAPITEKQKQTLIALASDPHICRGRERAFNFWVTPEAEVDAVFPEAIRRGYKKIARISAVHEGAISIINAFDRVNNGRLQVVLDETYPMEVRDFRGYLAKLQQLKDVDAIMMVVFPGQISMFAKQTRQMGLNLPLFSFELFEDPAEVKASDGTLIGQWYTSADDPDGEFTKKYMQRFPGASMYASANGYDTARLIAAALKAGQGGKDTYKYLASLKDFSDGVMGTYSVMEDHRFTLPAGVKVVTKDGFEKVVVK